MTFGPVLAQGGDLAAILTILEAAMCCLSMKISPGLNPSVEEVPLSRA